MKAIKYIASAALVICALAACSKKDVTDKSNIKLPEPKNQSQTQLWTIPEDSRPTIPIPFTGNNGGGAVDEPQTGELTKLEILPGSSLDNKGENDNQYLATFTVTGKNQGGQGGVNPGDPKDLDQKCVIGKYTVVSAKAEGDIYLLEGLGYLEITKTGFKLTLLSEEELEVAAETATPVDVEDVIGDVFRTWKIEKTFLTVKAENVSSRLGAGVEFAGCDANAIVKELAADGINVKLETPGYVVKNIFLSLYGTFAINFENGTVFAGDCKITGKDFSYELDAYETEGNPLISGKATGKIEMVKKKCNLTINADFKDKSSSAYSVSIKFIMVEG